MGGVGSGRHRRRPAAEALPRLVASEVGAIARLCFGRDVRDVRGVWVDGLAAFRTGPGQGRGQWFVVCPACGTRRRVLFRTGSGWRCYACAGAVWQSSRDSDGRVSRLLAALSDDDDSSIIALLSAPLSPVTLKALQRLKVFEG